MLSCLGVTGDGAGAQADYRYFLFGLGA